MELQLKLLNVLNFRKDILNKGSETVLRHSSTTKKWDFFFQNRVSPYPVKKRENEV